MGKYTARILAIEITVAVTAIAVIIATFATPCDGAIGKYVLLPIAIALSLVMTGTVAAIVCRAIVGAVEILTGGE